MNELGLSFRLMRLPSTTRLLTTCTEMEINQRKAERSLAVILIAFRSLAHSVPGRFRSSSSRPLEEVDS
jgi:hypothetical protein